MVRAKRRMVDIMNDRSEIPVCAGDHVLVDMRGICDPGPGLDPARMACLVIDTPSNGCGEWSVDVWCYEMGGSYSVTPDRVTLKFKAVFEEATCEKTSIG